MGKFDKAGSSRTESETFKVIDDIDATSRNQTETSYIYDEDTNYMSNTMQLLQWPR